MPIDNPTFSRCLRCNGLDARELIAGIRNTLKQVRNGFRVKDFQVLQLPQLKEGMQKPGNTVLTLRFNSEAEVEDARTYFRDFCEMITERFGESFGVDFHGGTYEITTAS